MTQDHDPGLFRLMLSIQEGAPEKRLYAEEREEVFGDGRDGQRFGPARGRDARTVAANRSHLCEVATRRPPVRKVGKGGELAPNALIRAADDVELAGAVERQRTKKDSVYDAEQRRVRADAQREGQDGHGREQRRSPEHACGVLEIPPDLCEPHASPHVPDGVLHLPDASEV
jgi:hypothetical protein